MEKKKEQAIKKKKVSQQNDVVGFLFPTSGNFWFDLIKLY